MGEREGGREKEKGKKGLGGERGREAVDHTHPSSTHRRGYHIRHAAIVTGVSGHVGGGTVRGRSLHTRH